MAHSELIARLEAATGACRELDARICIALGLSKDNVMVGVDGWCINSETNPNPYRSPAYTASIDAAVTLVPEGWGGSIHLSEDRPDCELHCTVSLGRSYPTNANTYAEKSGKDATRASVALAICIAALRARAGGGG